eukprot:4685645-Pyramimonas_sp.AAC.1
MFASSSRGRGLMARVAGSNTRSQKNTPPISTAVVYTNHTRVVPTTSRARRFCTSQTLTPTGRCVLAPADRPCSSDPL